MCSYHGGKQRIGLEIAENIHLLSTIIEQHSNFTIRGYCEPFCGMLGVYRHIPELFKDHRPKLKYKAGDANESVIMMWQAAQKGWKPPSKHYTKAMYEKLYHMPSSATKGFIGHVYTYRGIFMDSYFPHKQSKIQANRQRVINIAKNIKDVKFNTGSYTQFSNLKGYIIYCDPPYQESEQRYYNNNRDKLSFDSDMFWNWCRKMSNNNVVIVSEYSAPSDFLKIYEKNTIITGTGNNDLESSRIEGLFIYKPK